MLMIQNSNSRTILPLSTITGSTFKTVIVKTPAFKSLGPLIVSCPHAGRIYPFEFVSSAKVEIDELRGLGTLRRIKLFVPSSKLV